VKPKAQATLILATGNAHKVQELRAILGDPFQYLTLNDFPRAPAVNEDADTFAGNATKKSVGLAHWLAADANFRIPDSGIFILADDSGLEVDALSDAPGVHSARFAALDSGQTGSSRDAANNAKLLGLLGDTPWEQRSARFRCVIALTPLAMPGPRHRSPVCYADDVELQTELFEGICEGRISFEPRGRGGFGYDPLFIPAGQQVSFAELGEAVKNQLSHRAKALAKVRRRLI
jgi:XTP/dITP diphosphohydrolase